MPFQPVPVYQGGGFGAEALFEAGVEEFQPRLIKASPTWRTGEGLMAGSLDFA